MKKTYHGSCHCGAIRFAADLDLTETTSRCNCSICMKARFWKQVVPADAFRLAEGEEALSEYLFAGHAIRHVFCRHCGIKPFGRGQLEGFGPFIAVNLVCLDDATDAELAGAPVVYEDGRHDRWEAPPSETRHL